MFTLVFICCFFVVFFMPFVCMLYDQIQKKFLTITPSVSTLTELFQGRTFNEYLFYSSRHSVGYAVHHHILMKFNFDTPTHPWPSQNDPRARILANTCSNLHAIQSDMPYDCVPKNRKFYLHPVYFHPFA